MCEVVYFGGYKGGVLSALVKSDRSVRKLARKLPARPDSAEPSTNT